MELPLQRADAMDHIKPSRDGRAMGRTNLVGSLAKPTRPSAKDYWLAVTANGSGLCSDIEQRAGTLECRLKIA